MKTRLLIIIAFVLISFVIPTASASCAAPLFGDPGPCFDSFSVRVDDSNVPIHLTEQSIMENFARNIEMTYDGWQISDKNWTHTDSELELELPAIICTEFVAEGMKHYRMAKWVDEIKISSWEDHYNPSLCDKWLAPIDDGIKLKWDEDIYPSDDTGIIQVIDKDMNLDSAIIDVFEIHVWSDTDHDGINLTVTETENDAGIFYGRVFFTTTNESNGVRLLVEDAVYAEHKSNVDKSKIINNIEHMPYGNYVDFRNAEGEIIEVGCSSGLRASGNYNFGEDFLQSLKCNTAITLISAFVIIGIIVGIVFIIRRKRI